MIRKATINDIDTISRIYGQIPKFGFKEICIVKCEFCGCGTVVWRRHTGVAVVPVCFHGGGRPRYGCRRRSWRPLRTQVCHMELDTRRGTVCHSIAVCQLHDDNHPCRHHRPCHLLGLFGYIGVCHRVEARQSGYDGRAVFRA